LPVSVLAARFVRCVEGRRPDLDTTIVGTINPAYLQTNLEILQKGPLLPELYEEASEHLKGQLLSAS
jgi:hypothetical protein